MLLIPTFLCPKSWEKMAGDDRERFCAYCQKQVHNLEALAPAERLALLASPAAKLCSRYRAAIRRPKAGHQLAYARHLAKYGAGVALAGTVVVVLWEIHNRAHRVGELRPAHTLYRVPTECGVGVPMPGEYYEQRETQLLGDIMMPTPSPRPFPLAGPPDGPAGPQSHIDVKLDPREIDDLFRRLAPPQPVPPSGLRGL